MAAGYKKALLGQLGADDGEQPEGLQPLGNIADPTITGNEYRDVQAKPLAAMTNNPGIGEGWTYTGGNTVAGPPLVNTGVAGGKDRGPLVDTTGPMSSEGPQGPAATDYTKLGKFADQMGPWNASNEKFQKPWDQMSERYKMLTIMSNFDPRQGVTPELVDALNKANIKGAKFSGSGDKLSATGLNQWENYNGREGVGDVVRGFKTGQGTWTPWGPEGGDTGGAANVAAGGGFAGHAGTPVGGAQLDEALSGDPLARIQQMIAQLSGSRPNFAALMQQLGGGG